MHLLSEQGIMIQFQYLKPCEEELKYRVPNHKISLPVRLWTCFWRMAFVMPPCNWNTPRPILPYHVLRLMPAVMIQSPEYTVNEHRHGKTCTILKQDGSNHVGRKDGY